MDETERLLNNGTIQSFISGQFILWGREAKVIIPRLLLQKAKGKRKNQKQKYQEKSIGSRYVKCL